MNGKWVSGNSGVMVGPKQCWKTCFISEWDGEHESGVGVQAMADKTCLPIGN